VERLRYVERLMKNLSGSNEKRESLLVAISGLGRQEHLPQALLPNLNHITRATKLGVAPASATAHPTLGHPPRTSASCAGIRFLGPICRRCANRMRLARSARRA